MAIGIENMVSSARNSRSRTNRRLVDSPRSSSGAGSSRIVVPPLHVNREFEPLYRSVAGSRMRTVVLVGHRTNGGRRRSRAPRGASRHPVDAPLVRASTDPTVFPVRYYGEVVRRSRGRQRGRWSDVRSARTTVQGKPVVRRGRNARDLPSGRTPGCRGPKSLKWFVMAYLAQSPWACRCRRPGHAPRHASRADGPDRGNGPSRTGSPPARIAASDVERPSGRSTRSQTGFRASCVASGTLVR